MYLEFGKNFVFVASTPITEERLRLGYEDMNKKYPFVLTTYDSQENEKKALQLAKESDYIIHGSSEIKYVNERVKYNLLTFLYTERPFKRSKWQYLKLNNVVSMLNNRVKYKNKNIYMLCASAYTPLDYKLGPFKNKFYKWGYFPATLEYKSINKITENKKKNSLIWIGRFIKFKHPEIAVYVAKRLKEDGYKFELKMIGNGDLEHKIKQLIIDNSLEDYVKLLGAMTPVEVREYMENSEIFMFTSNREEGWGAVLNESMNSACAIVASHVIGSVPFLIEDGQNGLIYNNKDFHELYLKVKYLIDNPKERETIGVNAYKTITTQWNANNAANRLNILAKKLLEEKNPKNLFKDGVCSPAEYLKDNWHHTIN